MNKRVIHSVFLLIFLFTFASCREYFPTTPSPANEAQLTIIYLDSLYHATENEPIAIGFDVKIVDEANLPVVGIPLDITAFSDEGSLAIPELISNEDGLVHALYYNPKPLDDCTVQIQILLNGDTLSSEFKIDVRPSAAAIKAEYNQQTIYVKPNVMIEKSISFKITNTEGKPVPFADVAFRIISGEAAIESVAYADRDGIVRAFMTFMPTKNCEIVVQAEVRFIELESDEDSGGVLRVNILRNLPQVSQPQTAQLLRANSTIKVVLE